MLGCMKLMCGGILCCRKTKAQEHHDNLIKKGVDPKCEYIRKSSLPGPIPSFSIQISMPGDEVVKDYTFGGN